MFNISTSVLTMLQPIVLFTPFTASLDAGSIAQKVGGELEYIISSSYLSLYRLEILSILLYLPFLCRVFAFLLAAPVALFITLDLIAYGIARTLHLSMSAERVPRTPPIESKALLASDISREVDVPGGVDKLSDSPSDRTDAYGEIEILDDFIEASLSKPATSLSSTSLMSIASTISTSSAATSSSSSSEAPVIRFDRHFPPGPRNSYGQDMRQRPNKVINAFA